MQKTMAINETLFLLKSVFRNTDFRKDRANDSILANLATLPAGRNCRSTRFSNNSVD